MIGQNIINHVFDNNIRNLFNSKNSKGINIIALI